MAIQIGAKIGLEGESEYLRVLKLIVKDTKELANETKLLKASFDGNKGTIQQNTKYKEALQKQISSLNDVISKEKARLEEVKNTMGNSSVATQKQLDAVDKLTESITKNETQLAQWNNELKNAPSNIELVRDAMNNAKNTLTEWGGLLTDIGKGLTLFATTPIVAGMTASTNAAKNWESGFVGVTKTVNEIYDSNQNLVYSYDDLSESLKDVAKNSTISYKDLLQVGETAGQLGISADNVAEFSEIMLKLGATTQMTADEAATNIARILNITSKGGREFEVNGEMANKFGNAIVELGNSFATTEPEIALMSTRLASAGTTAGLSTPDILALATAMSAVGIKAEAGGSAMAQTLVALEKAVSGVGENADEKLQRIAELSGMTAQQFSQAWKDEPVKAVAEFIKGLGTLDEESESATIILDELGMSGIRQSNMIKALSNAYPVLENAVKKANDEWNRSKEEIGALDVEYEKWENTLEGKAERMRNNLALLGVELGENLMPILKAFVDTVSGIAQALAKLPEPIQTFLLAISGIVAVVGPALLIVGSIMKTFGTLTVVAQVLGTTVSAMSLVFLKWVAVGAAVVAAVVAIGYIINWLIEHSEELEAFWEALAEGAKMIWEDIKTAVGNAVNAIVTKWTEFKTNLIAKTTEIKNNVVSKIVELATSIKNDFINAKNVIVNAFQTMKSNLMTTLSNLYNSVKTTASNIGTAITNGISGAIEWLKGLGSSAWSWGYDMIQSFANGVKNAISAAVSAVSSVASKVRSYLHFSEPDVGPLSDFHTYMPDMMKLMAKGITDNSYLVEDAVNGVAKTMTFSGSTLGVGSNANSYNYGGININLNVSDNVTGSRIMDEIEEELARRMNNRKAVFNQ